jgi:hypothetical protein
LLDTVGPLLELDMNRSRVIIGIVVLIVGLGVAALVTGVPFSGGRVQPESGDRALCQEVRQRRQALLTRVQSGELTREQALGQRQELEADMQKYCSERPR